MGSEMCIRDRAQTVKFPQYVLYRYVMKHSASLNLGKIYDVLNLENLEKVFQRCRYCTLPEVNLCNGLQLALLESSSLSDLVRHGIRHLLNAHFQNSNAFLYSNARLGFY